MNTIQIKSRWWYILPLLLSIDGGLISFFIIRHDDPTKARNCLVIGGFRLLLDISLVSIFASVIASSISMDEFIPAF
ncbi:MAG: hypothetical protein R1F52_05570 [Candidatus Nitrosoabyssus spongiisocia]|nr:MAG: hypothetical protein R1F52_05570 [Nitrosopumilaceae archaeon AB1(1)]